MQPILDRYGAQVVLYGQTRMVYWGAASQRFCGLIAYRSMDDLKRLSHDPEFARIRDLRDRSTANYVLTAIEGFPTVLDAAEHLENGGK